jgi:hypothetical protein
VDQRARLGRVAGSYKSLSQSNSVSRSLSVSLSSSRCSVAKSLVGASFLLAEHVVATGIYIVVFSVAIRLVDVIGAEVRLLWEINCP